MVHSICQARLHPRRIRVQLWDSITDGFMKGAEQVQEVVGRFLKFLTKVQKGLHRNAHDCRSYKYPYPKTLFNEAVGLIFSLALRNLT